MSDDQLNRLIDDVARQMTRGQLSNDFRARVIASLDRRPRRMWRPLWIVAPLGALAAIIVAMAIARPSSSRPVTVIEPVRVIAEAPKRDRPPAPSVRLKPDTTYDPAAPAAVAPHATGGRVYRPTDATAAVDALAPPRLELIPIGVPALGVDRLPTESIAVPALDAIAPIPVDPLPPDDRR